MTLWGLFDTMNGYFFTISPMSSGTAFLESLGLETIEAQVYETALALGTVPASIIANRLGIPRSSARYTCERLIKKGLMIGSIEGNTKIYTVENPTKLYSLVIEQEEALEKKREQLGGVVKDFQKLYNPYTSLPKVTFYEGTDGIDRLLEEITEKSANCVTFGAGDYFLDRVPDVVKKFRRNAAKQYKSAKILRVPKYRERHTDEKDPSRRTRYFRFLEELKIDIQIVEDKIAISSIASGASVGVLIKHQEIAEAFRQIFEEVWRNSEE